MNVAFLPVYPNPYQHLLRDALAAEGVTVHFLEGLPSAQWLKDNTGRIDILHYHWLDGLYMKRLSTPLQSWRFVNRFRLSRSLGYRSVWTAHNILPHRPIIQPLHIAIRRLIMTETDAVIAHCEFGRRELISRFPRSGPTHVIPIGNYGGIYPVTMTRDEARASFGLEPAQYVYLALGNIARYKGLERLLVAFGQTGAASDRVIIAGRNRDNELVKQLRDYANRDSRVRLVAEYIPDEDMQRYLLAADVMVAPFENILTSSSVLVGLSHGLPVIVPNLGCLPELITENAGIVYDAKDPVALPHALDNIKSLDHRAMGAAAARIAASLNWRDIGRQTAGVYLSCIPS